MTKLLSRGVRLKPDYSIRALTRTSEILNRFTLSEPEKSLTQIARETGLHKSTVFRIMDTLEGIKWVRKDPKSGMYRLGFAILEMGSRAINGLDFYRVSMPYLEELVNETSNSAHLVIHDDGEVLYLNKVENPEVVVKLSSRKGFRAPLTCTAVGKVLLADMEPEEVLRIIERRGLPQKTANSIVNPELLFQVLENVKAEGYAVDDEENEIGIRCVAAPLRDFSGRVVAAISVSGLRTGFGDVPKKIQAVTEAAKNISLELGYCNIG